VESLSRLQIFHCKTSLQFLATVHSLPFLLSSLPDTKVVMVDSISSFYWMDRMEGTSRDVQEYNQRQFVYAMRGVMQTFRLVLFVTKPVYFTPRPNTISAGGAGASEDSESPPLGAKEMPAVPLGLMHKEHMSQTWTRFVRFRFIISKLPRVIMGKSTPSPKFIGKILTPHGRKIHYFSFNE